jgi:hypothetical protein
MKKSETKNSRATVPLKRFQSKFEIYPTLSSSYLMDKCGVGKWVRGGGQQGDAHRYNPSGSGRWLATWGGSGRGLATWGGSGRGLATWGGSGRGLATWGDSMLHRNWTCNECNIFFPCCSFDCGVFTLSDLLFQAKCLKLFRHYKIQIYAYAVHV